MQVAHKDSHINQQVLILAFGDQWQARLRPSASAARLAEARSP